MSRMPTEPGWWWRQGLDVVRVYRSVFSGGLAYRAPGGARAVTDDGLWIATVASPEEVERLRAEVENLRITLSLEYGHKEHAPEGWTTDFGKWYQDQLGCCVWRERWWCYWYADDGESKITGTAPNVREAMLAAEAAARKLAAGGGGE